MPVLKYEAREIIGKINISPKNVLRIGVNCIFLCNKSRFNKIFYYYGWLGFYGKLFLGGIYFYI
jgi:hypothetical protein